MKKKQVYKPPPPKEVVVPPATEVDALEGRLRVAAGGYYEDPLIQKPKETAWMFNKPPGIIRRFKAFTAVLFPTARYEKKRKP